jgi:hypothetical protein
MNKILIILGVFILLFVISYFRSTIQKWFDHDDQDREYKLIKQHLLNDSPLYGKNKPKLWIHTKYELNARKWQSFQSRTSTDLNQPYIYLTVQSIIHHCGDDFHICLIDDYSFSRLIPSWNGEMPLDEMSEPKRSEMRQIGLFSLLHEYGGLLVPDSFVCSRSLIELYQNGIRGKKPFICEKKNRTKNVVKESKKSKLYVPDTGFMGSRKNDKMIEQCIDYLKSGLGPHYSAEKMFLGTSDWWIMDKIMENKINLIDGKWIGIKNNKEKPILMEDLISNGDLDIYPYSFGIVIPEDEILKRTKYQWFSVMSVDEIIESNMIIAKYLKESCLGSKPLPAFSIDRNVVVL